jgi:hypothetical protein
MPCGSGLEREWANPSSIHRAGTAARRRVELARESVARLLGCQERELLFSSGGTESANLAIFGTLEHLRASAPARRVLVTSRLEHSAVRESADAWQRRGGEVLWAVQDASGVVDCDWLADTLRHRAAEIALVSLMWVNNEDRRDRPDRPDRRALPRARSPLPHRRNATRRPHACRSRGPSSRSPQLRRPQVPRSEGDRRALHPPRRSARTPSNRPVRRSGIAGAARKTSPGIVGMGTAADAARRWMENRRPDQPRPDWHPLRTTRARHPSCLSRGDAERLRGPAHLVDDEHRLPAPRGGSDSPPSLRTRPLRQCRRRLQQRKPSIRAPSS